MSEQSAKQQIIDKIKDVDTVLVTVSSSPTVDELSAALGFTLLINKLNKHATAVFSGDIPPAITFLDPEKTFENTVNSLRDFIIALDKEKADHLRYKVDGDMVKIFITPYRTTIDERDLDFSQGDYNVEMVVAVGVKSIEDLDKALADHGRIMHDATVASLSIGGDSSELGSLNWHEGEASSYSEMLVSLSEALRNDKNLIDEQIATAFLTGIVAATERFSNSNTTSKSMTMAAQLMAAGANQQLIATRLEEANELPSSTSQASEPKSHTNNDGTTTLDADVPTKVDRNNDMTLSEIESQVKDKQAPDGSMTISHEKQGDLEDVAEQVEKDNQAAATKKAEDMLANSLAQSMPQSSKLPSVADLQKDIKQAAAERDDDAAKPMASDSVSLPPPTPEPEQAPMPHEEPDDPDRLQFEPTFGGTLNATSEQAAEDKRREEMADRNKSILSHDGSSYAADPNKSSAVNSFNQPAEAGLPEVPSSPGPESSVSTHGFDLQPISMPAPSADTSFQSLADLDRDNRVVAPAPSAADAQSAIADALESAPSMSQQQDQIPKQSSFESAPDTSTPPPLPPMPDFSTLPPLPPEPGMSMPEQNTSSNAGLPTVSPVNTAPQQPTTPRAPSDPGQFQIPGQ